MFLILYSLSLSPTLFVFRSRGGAGTGKDSGLQNSSSRPGTKEPVKEETVLGHLDQIDKTIQEILNSSTLENVSTYVWIG